MADLTEIKHALRRLSPEPVQVSPDALVATVRARFARRRRRQACIAFATGIVAFATGAVATTAQLHGNPVTRKSFTASPIPTVPDGEHNNGQGTAIGPEPCRSGGRPLVAVNGNNVSVNDALLPPKVRVAASAAFTVTGAWSSAGSTIAELSAYVVPSDVNYSDYVRNSGTSAHRVLASAQSHQRSNGGIRLTVDGSAKLSPKQTYSLIVVYLLEPAASVPAECQGLTRQASVTISMATT